MLWYFCISTRILAQNRGELNERTICKYVGKVASLKGGHMESHVPYETEARKPFLDSAERVSESESKGERALAATVGNASSWDLQPCPEKHCSQYYSYCPVGGSPENLDPNLCLHPTKNHQKSESSGTQVKRCGLYGQPSGTGQRRIGIGWNSPTEMSQRNTVGSI